MVDKVEEKRINKCKNISNILNIDCLPEKTGALYELKKKPDDLQEVIKLKYIGKKQISPNTFIFTYELPNKDMCLGLNLGQHIAIE